MTCPICGKEPEAKYRPFCSRRCADVDLGRWLKGSYAIPAEVGDEDEAAAPADPDGRPPRPQ
ncbi:DNA gyrase inhibitor YacG [Rhodobacteraceae bacterium HSP-20]|uniref:DNA gyrase inhibitor YacG n=1 Tax=Paragemmobacter amnigenus TaxID=2852097 RepID=A0ABS6J4A6_9RHOB|nr:DNA gyrase inhibitor YacG [Rhodobacter amnigenus]MBU9697287.1 DNA gyrase inhibitor YacG [Rhodobacter amnigenus]MBV4388514.1 DNA gyrase inhibitor YacG [Rhodobacter amnigenus]